MGGELVLKGAETMSPLALFMQADIIVKMVMLGLLAASVWTWAIIINHGSKLRKISRETELFEKSFWASDDIDAFYTKAAKSDLPVARVFSSGVNEWRRSVAGKVADREGVRGRLATAMSVAINREIDQLSDRLNMLATIGSVAPFVGLFGTVWGIMRSFTGIAAAQNTSLAVVAPGIAEALFATAIGLFAAIPAVIGYNRLLHGVGRLETRLAAFSDEFHGLLGHELERADR